LPLLRSAEAMTTAKGTDFDKVVKALEGLKDFKTLGGPLTFMPDHTRSGGGFVIVSIDPSSGQFVLKDDLQG
ncbi:MAG: ABC transporter substrate-binding protein, partial [Actinomycetes bacterium]